MSKELFKKFARKNPTLADTVLKGDATWQQLYELYEIYGEKNHIWQKYTEPKESTISSFKEIFNTFKNLDVDSVQQGINNLQKTIGLLQDLGIGNSLTNNKPTPIYQKFND